MGYMKRKKQPQAHHDAVPDEHLTTEALANRNAQRAEQAEADAAEPAEQTEPAAQ